MSGPGLFHVFPDISRSKRTNLSEIQTFPDFTKKKRKTAHFSRLFRLLPTLYSLSSTDKSEITK